MFYRWGRPAFFGYKKIAFLTCQVPLRTDARRGQEKPLLAPFALRVLATLVSGYTYLVQVCSIPLFRLHDQERQHRVRPGSLLPGVPLPCWRCLCGLRSLFAGWPRTTRDSCVPPARADSPCATRCTTRGHSARGILKDGVGGLLCGCFGGTISTL